MIRFLKQSSLSALMLLLAALPAEHALSQVLTWSGLPPLNTPRTGMGCDILGGNIYVLGGFTANCNASSAMEMYVPGLNQWLTRTAMPAARSFPVAVAVNGKLYAMGGSGNCDSTHHKEA